MSDEEIYRRIGELEQQIAELRGKLPSAPDWKGPKLRPEGRLQKQKKGEPFRISSEAELELSNLPDLVRLIFDALPVQIFIKKSAIVDSELGRPYTYLNQKAREIKGWRRGEERGKYDRDIFAMDDEGDQLFTKMVAQESITLTKDPNKHEWESRLTETEWNEKAGNWSRNRNIEIPLLDQHGDRVIGFCSIANNLVFLELPREWAHYQSCAQHHVGNLLDSLDGWLLEASAILNTLQAGNFTADDAKAPLASALENILRSGQRLKVHRTSSDFQIMALDSSIGKAPEVGTIQEIVETLQGAYKNCGFDLNIPPVSDRNQTIRVFQPKVVKAILSVFIANAVVRGPGEYGPMIDRIDVSVEYDRHSAQVTWTVSNRCESNAKLPPSDYFEPPNVNGPLDRGFDRRLLMRLISSFFPGSKAEQMISFSKPTKTEWSVQFVARIEVDTHGNN